MKRGVAHSRPAVAAGSSASRALRTHAASGGYLTPSAG